MISTVSICGSLLQFSGLCVRPAHAVEGDVPLENMLAFIDTVKSQRAYIKRRNQDPSYFSGVA